MPERSDAARAGFSWSGFEARLLLGALLLRLLYLTSIAGSPFFQHPVGDELQYDSWAQTLVAGRSFFGNYPYWDSPLYAYVLGAIYRLFGHDLYVVRLAQILVGTLNVLLLYRLALRVTDETTARVVGILAATYLPFVYFEGLLLKETIALCVLDGTLLMLLGAIARPTLLACWATGVLLGLLTLARINALALVGAALLTIWVQRSDRRWPATVAVLLGVAMMIAPVTLRNRVVSGEWVLISAAGGQVLFAANNPDNTTGDSVPTPGVRFTPLYERIDFHTRAERETGRRLTPTEMSAYWRGKAIAFMREQPWTVARMVGHRFLRFWNQQEIPDNHSIVVFRRLSWVLNLPLPGYWLIAPFALIGLWLMRRRWRAWLPLYGFLAIYLLSLMPTWVTSRYRLPIVGVLMLFAAAAMVELWRQSRDPNRAWRSALMLGAACVVCWWPLSRPAVDEYDRHLAFAYVQDGRPDAALPLYRNLLILHQQPTDELLYAYALGRAGQMPDALAILGRLAGDDRPVEIRHRAYAYRGDLAREQKEWPIAIAAYRKAIEVDPNDSAAWNSLAVCWIATGQLDEAEDALAQA
ncbi:MAG TPA: glycosyltransferase family 39 protein, partial [Nitrospirales bacterium]|nr:glycosyltransferase family 39 protein [Nitrospirales bacterium]